MVPRIVLVLSGTGETLEITATTLTPHATSIVVPRGGCRSNPRSGWRWGCLLT
jgi:hypothetical protein